MSLSNYLENKILDHIVGKTAFTMPTAYVALSTADPGEDGSGIAEPSGNNYARKATAGADWNAASAGAISNANALEFNQASGSWGELTHLAIFDALTNGNMLAKGRLKTLETTLAEHLDETENAITLADASGLDTSGTIIIDDEQITYTGKTGNELTGCTRGANGTTATAHLSGGNVFVPVSKTIGANDTPRFAAGELDMTLN